MANVINATSTGNGGLVSTGDDSGILNIQTNETTAITIDASQNVNFAGTLTATNITNSALSTQRVVVSSTGGILATSSNLTFTADNILRNLPWYNNTTGSGANTFLASDGSLGRSTSSLKYKKDVENARFSLSDLMKLRAVNYKSKSEKDGNTIYGGLIAEEVHQSGLTEFVQYAEDGSPDALAYGNMVALCVKAIQELKTINDTQAETINALTARIVALEGQ